MAAIQTSFFNHLWDETVAGPFPDSGQVRRFSSSNSAAASLDIIPAIAGGCDPSSPALRRKKVAQPRSPTVYDWVMIGSLDR
ncbi:uncharacterized protein LOC110026049 [Phalaenopsis equestris]|uniref:uncharacterized protein LOC110026049 n=1 Tax=Phalaenopsis equestris TaxID=78828 RepID=UPI0009E279F5|nr:uncharacterized protein LOC110026049 [Phalaenopsis equestris]